MNNYRPVHTMTKKGMGKIVQGGHLKALKEMATPRTIRHGGTQALQDAAHANNIVMIDALTGLTEEGALDVIRRQPIYPSGSVIPPDP